MTILGLAAFAAQPALGHDGAKHAEGAGVSGKEVVIGTPMDPVAEEKARAYFTDLPVVTQNGEKLRFFSDVLKGRIVVVTLFYTDCVAMCPITNAKLAEVQDILGDLFGRDVFFVSVSLDPETDTPEVLKEYAAKFGARDGWLFLTGSKDDIKRITYRLGQTADVIETHSPFFMVGNVPQAHWVKVRPNVPALALVEQIRRMAGLPMDN